MQSTMLTEVVSELALLLPGARVERVFQADSGICLVLRRARKDYFLLISPDRALPRVHLVAKKPPASSSPHAMALYLRSHLTGATLAGVACLDLDRIVEIRLSSQDKDFRLVCELFGSAANLLLLDGVSMIQAVYYPVAPADNAKRALLPGTAYMSPQKKRDQTAAPLLPVRKRPQDEIITADDALANRSAELYFDGVTVEKELTHARHELCRVLNKDLSKVYRRINALSSDLTALDRAEEYRQAGELILANLCRIERGLDHADLAGYDDVVVPVQLDPGRTPAQNAERYFKRYKKAKSGQGKVQARLQQAQVQAAYLSSQLSAVDSAQGIEEVTRIRSELTIQDKTGSRKKNPGSKKQEPSVPAFRKTVFRGWEILVGRSAAGNDYITTKLARPKDLWLHAEGMPGSHVLIRNPGGEEIPPDILTRAASYAAFYSKGRSGGKVSVTYTRAGCVGKPKGAKPGMVTLTERRSIMAVPEELL